MRTKKTRRGVTHYRPFWRVRNISRFPRARHLSFEQLETRRLLATVFWDGGAGTTNWGDAANWSGDVLPGTADDVVIEANAPGGSTIVFSTISAGINTLQSEKALNVTSGTLSIGGASTINSSLTVSGGTLAGDGDVTVSGALNWTGGTMSGAGTTIVAPGGMLAITGSSGNKYLISRTLIHAGTGTWSGTGALVTSFGATFRNVGTLTLQSDASIFQSGAIGGSGADGHFQNAGTLIKSGGTGENFILIPFDNDGTIDIRSGTIRAGKGGSSTQGFRIAGGRLRLTGGNFDVHGPVELDGALEISSATLFAGGAAIDGAGVLDVRSTVTIESDSQVGRFEINAGSLMGSGNVTVVDELIWYGGTMGGSGKTIVDGSLSIMDTLSSPSNYLQRTLENRGTATINSSRFYLGHPNSVVDATLRNLSGATMTLQAGGIFVTGSGTLGNLVLDNQGTFVRAGSGAAQVDASFDNSGTIQVDSGTLHLRDTSFHSTVVTNRGAIDLVGGSLLLNAPTSFEQGSTVSGTGLLEVNTTLTVTADVTIPRLRLGSATGVAAGTITGGGDLTVTDELVWYVGTMSGSGATISRGALRITGRNAQILDGRTLVNSGAAVLDKPASAFSYESLQLTNGGTIRNMAGAVWNFQSTSSSGSVFLSASGGATFDNLGRIIHSGAVTTVFRSQLNNSGAIHVGRGTLRIEPSTVFGHSFVNQGNIELIGGSLSIAGGISFPDPSGLSSLSTGTMSLSGSVLGSSRAEPLFDSQGIVRLTGPGSASSPQWFEVMGRDFGPVSTGFDKNFSHGTIQLQSTYVRLQDQSDNSPGADSEALYVDVLTVPSGSTLDLNGLPLYVRQANIQGNIIGNLTLVPDGGPLVRNSNNPGTISAVGEIDEWTFYGRSGSAVTLIAEPGSSGALGVTTPYLGGVKVTLLAPNGTEVASGESATVGQRVTLSGIDLPQEGVYRVRVEANALAATGRGNYGVSLFDASVYVASLVFNQRELGVLATPYAIDRWTFVASANDQIRLDILAAQQNGLRFNLNGPQGWTGFSGQTSDSDLITLPFDGTYTLDATFQGSGYGGYSFKVEKTNVSDLDLGVPYTGVLQGTGAAQLFRFDVQQPGPLLIELDDAKASNRNEVYVGYGKPPTRRTFDFRTDVVGGSHSLPIPFARAGEWFILVYGQSTAVDSPFDLQVKASTGSISAVAPNTATNDGRALVELTGLGFVPGTSVSLSNANGQTITASAVSIVNLATAVAAIDLAGAPLGIYDVQVAFPNGDFDILENAFRVESTGSAVLETRLIMPTWFGRHVLATIYVEYANTGTAPMPAPILTLESADPDGSDRPLLTLDHSRLTVGLWTHAVPEGFGTSAQIYAQGQIPGLLQPGERVRVPVYYAGLQRPWDFSDTQVEMQIRIRDAEDDSLIDWNAYIDEFKPETVAADAWQATIGVLIDQMGQTWGEYIKTLSEDASYLHRLGEGTSAVDELFGFEYRQADGIGAVPILASAVDASVPSPGLPLAFGRTFGNSISQRYRVGPFGRGWQASTQASLTVSNDGTVDVLEPGGAIRKFQPDIRYPGRYLSDLGDRGTLRLVSGGEYQLSEFDGAMRQFQGDGKLSFVRDVNGNRIDYGYSADRLTSMTHSSGEFLAFTYNAAGRIESITDSTGWTTTYTYDFSNMFLLNATNPAGTTSYTYVTGQGAAREYALASIIDASGVTRHFEYDNLGRLAATYVNGDESRVEYDYDQPGRVVVTDESGVASKLYFDQDGQLVRSEDSTGSYVRYEYDDAGNLIRTTDLMGATQEFGWSRSGQLLTLQDQLRGELRFTPGGPNNQPLSFTDTRGNTIRYQYDAVGNLLGRIFPDNSIERFEYDANGNLIGVTNRRNQEIVRTVNPLGQLVLEEFPDGSTISYAYDTFNRLQSVNDRGKITSYTYDSADRVTRIDYPAGRWIAYDYDAAGRQTRLEDHTGHVVQYLYDTAGRLFQLRDADDSVIVTYAYDAAGRLSRETHGNSTTASYTYDATGRIQTVLNERADGTDNSRFDYAYDTLGRRVGMTTLDGAWTYEYDATGQLIHAVFASTLPEIANQDLTYVYDSAGNRIRTIHNGVETEYTVNNMNQITAVGDTSYEYGRDGNLVRQVTPEGTWVYTYNVENRLTRVSGPDGVWEYEYDAFGNRIASIDNGERTEYLIDSSGLGSVIGIYDSAGGRTISYVHGLGLEAAMNAAASYYYDFDAIGSTSGISAGDGTYINKYAFTPFGTTILSNEPFENSFEFVGREGVMNEINGLHYMRARYYAAELGRFVAQDPLRHLAGDANLYRYGSNSPSTAIDPSGLDDSIVISWGCSFVDPFKDCSSDGWGGSYNGWGGSIGGAKNLYNTFRTYLPKFPSFPVPSPSPTPISTPTPIPTPTPTLIPTPTPTPTVTPTRTPTPTPLPPADECVEDDPIDIIGSYLTEPSCRPGDSGDSGTANSSDPNEKLATGGFGQQGFIDADAIIPYRIRFENLGPGSDPVPARPATAPAQRVVVTDELSQDLDWSTLEFTQFGFGDYLIPLARPSQYHFQTLSVLIDDKSFDVEVELSFDSTKGMVRAVFQSIDPTIGLPPEVLTGFLPPEDGSGKGQGYFEFLISPKFGLPSGTKIRNVAEISFDGQTIIATNQVDPQDPSQGTDLAKEALITIDAAAPSSEVLALPATSDAEFAVQWTGTDDSGGSGIRFYDIYVAADDDPFTLWLNDTTDHSAIFTGVSGVTYRFYSQATDNVGHVEPAPMTADAFTTVVVAAPLSVDAGENLVANVGDFVHLTGASITFGGDLSELSGTVDWGDGTIEDLLLAPVSGGAVLVNSHQYAANQTYFVVITVADLTGTSVSDALQVVVATVSNATPTITINWTGGTYNGSKFFAGGSVLGVDGSEIATPTFTYFAGLDTTGTPLAIAPVDAGTYTVQADFTGDALHFAATGTATIVIDKATSTIVVDGTTVTYDGTAHGATGSATGVNNEPLAGLHLGASFTNVPGGTANWVFTDVTGNYHDASGSVQIVIEKTEQTISWDAPLPIMHGTALSLDQFNAVVAVVGPAEPGELSYDPPAGTVLDVGLHQLTVTAAETANYLLAEATVELMVFKPYSISGLVFVDFNNDGEVNFGEPGIADVLLTLSGTDDLGNDVERQVWTDDDGFYKFDQLRPGEYYLTQTQPQGFKQGKNSMGTLGGQLVGEELDVDQFFLELGQMVVEQHLPTDAMDVNFGERPPAEGSIEAGQTAGIGFWQNRNGQALIQALGDGSQATQLGDWLAATMPNMFGALAGQSNVQVGQHFRTLFAVHGRRLEAQVMATALAVYVTDRSLSGDSGTAHGFTVTDYGVGTRLFNVGSSGAAFGLDDDSDLSVLDLLLLTDERTVDGDLFFNEDSKLRKAWREMANKVFDGINSVK